MKTSTPHGAVSHLKTDLPQDFHLRFFPLGLVTLRAPPPKMVVSQESEGLQRTTVPASPGWVPGLCFHFHPTLLPTLPFTAPRLGQQPGHNAREGTRKGAAAPGARTRLTSGNSRVTPRRRRARRGEAVADRWRLRTGSAYCAPQLPNRLPASPPAARSARQSARVRWWERSLRPFPRPPIHPCSLHPHLPLTLTPFSPPLPGSVIFLPHTLRTRMPCPEQPSST